MTRHLNWKINYNPLEFQFHVSGPRNLTDNDK